MNKYKQKCFELEQELQAERDKRINIEKVHSEELEEMQTRCHKAEEKSLASNKERIEAEDKYNKIYNVNINLRNNIEIEKSKHGSGLKNFSLLGEKFELE